MTAGSPKVSILPLLRSLSTDRANITPEDITKAITHIFKNELNPVQTGALLTALHFTKMDQRADIIAAAAVAMRGAGLKIEGLGCGKGVGEGGYHGGLVDIVGTGGDGHNTFNVSTTSSILASGCGLRIAKHGNKASTSSSGSADILTSLGASLLSITPPVVSQIFSEASPNNYCFLYAPVFHPAMSHVAPIRRELGCRTIFNLLGPLVNPVDYSLPNGGLEARIIGVAKKELGPVFAETLKILGVKKAMVVCGDELLDEISCQGRSEIWRLVENATTGEVNIKHFFVHPTTTFGLSTHPLEAVAGGKGPEENAVILTNLLNGGMERGDPVLDFVLVNTAALLVVSGMFEDVESAEEEERGDGEVVQGKAWKLAVERAMEGIKSGRAWGEWRKFVEASTKAAEAAVV